ncbi:MAG: SDR family oxidoreductase [Chloroflexi bacterium]|nr:SDR family oxidoreductase [Chloroflexota bacterium]
MRIEKVETWLVWRWLTVRITTDGGLQGVGEGTFWGYAHAAEEIAKAAGKDLIGQDPRHIEHIWNAAYRKYSFRSAAIVSAISAFDQALWDIKGKRYGAPVWDLLGGRVPSNNPYSPNDWSTSIDNPDNLKRRMAATPLGRLQTPEDIAKAFAFVASDDADMITGSNLIVDGGAAI